MRREKSPPIVVTTKDWCEHRAPQQVGAAPMELVRDGISILVEYRVPRETDRWRPIPEQPTVYITVQRES